MITPLELRCEYALNPMGIDVPLPRFGWVLGSSQRGQLQAAYRILVASSKEKLDAGIGDKWDSGRVVSDESVNVPYAGGSLASGERCWWKVRVWDQDGVASADSEPATFEMGLLKDSDWQGEWIGADAAICAPLLRREFVIPREVESARVYISGLGWYELYLNGEKVGDHVLDPATTDYTKRVLYVTYDVTDHLRRGANAAGVMLGNGWYSEPGWKTPYGDSPRMLIQMNIELTDGSRMSVASDETWKWSSGPITRNALYGGETYDARLEKPGWAVAGCDDASWHGAQIKASSGGRMTSQSMPAIRVNRTLSPSKLTNPSPGVYVYDMGQLFGGWARLRVQGERGTKVAVRYSERLFADSGLVDQSRHAKGEETDYYILKGDPQGEVYEPRFTYHPVQFVQIEGYPGEPDLQSLEGRVVYSAVDLDGDFQCSNPLLNQIHRNVVWTLTNELFGIPLDCLHREHWAWTDPATVASTLYTRKYMPQFWGKWLADIKDAQHDNGAVPDFAPNYLRRVDPDPAWGGNYPILVWYLHQYYGDRRILEEHCPSMTKWVDYLTSIAHNHLVTQGHYGDHMLPGEAPGKEVFISPETPPPLVWTAYYYRGASIVSQAARLLGKAKDAEHYARLAASIADAFNQEWLSEDGDHYATGSQTANLLPLALGIVPKAREEAVARNIVRDIVERHEGHLHTGNTGTTCMVDVLTQHGYGDVLYRVATVTSYPGWGYMAAEGATTIWESWSLQSQVGDAESMIMWASIDEFLYNDLAGIRGPDYYGPAYMTPGFRRIDIEPHVLGDLQYVRAAIKTVRGTVSSSWRRTGDAIALEVSIPVNSEARVSVPKMRLQDVSVTEGRELVWKAGRFVRGASGILAGSETDDYVILSVGSGVYSFVLKGSPQ